MYKFMELWKIFSEKNYVNRKIKHVTCQISTFAAILKILHPQCIAIPVRTPPGYKV